MLLAAAGAAAAGWLLNTARKRQRSAFASGLAEVGSAPAATPDPMSVDSLLTGAAVATTPAALGDADPTVRVLSFPSPTPGRNVRWWDLPSEQPSAAREHEAVEPEMANGSGVRKKRKVAENGCSDGFGNGVHGGYYEPAGAEGRSDIDESALLSRPFRCAREARPRAQRGAAAAQPWPRMHTPISRWRRREAPACSAAASVVALPRCGLALAVPSLARSLGHRFAPRAPPGNVAASRAGHSRQGNG